jgi:hypothetical protein
LFSIPVTDQRNALENLDGWGKWSETAERNTWQQLPGLPPEGEDMGPMAARLLKEWIRDTKE